MKMHVKISEDGQIVSLLRTRMERPKEYNLSIDDRDLMAAVQLKPEEFYVKDGELIRKKHLKFSMVTGIPDENGQTNVVTIPDADTVVSVRVGKNTISLQSGEELHISSEFRKQVTVELNEPYMFADALSFFMRGKA